jgi:hypothetical protein
MIEAALAPAAEFLFADRAAALLPLEHGAIFLGRDAVVVLEACPLHPRLDLAPVFRVFGATLAPARMDLAGIGGMPGPIRRENAFPELRILRITFAPPPPALGWGKLGRLALGAAAGRLPGMAPLAPAISARALAVTGHKMMRFPNARTHAAAERGREDDHAATQLGCSQRARSAVPVSGTAEIGAVPQA